MSRLNREAARTPFVADAGGVPAGSGTIPTGRMLRVSGELVTLAELRSLEAAGVRTYIDLRGPDEDRTRLSRWARRARIEYVAVPIALAGGRDLLRRIALGRGGEAGVDALYRAIVDGHGAAFAEAAGVIADGTPVAFGCAAGKDRTGVLAALLHDVLGVVNDDAARSYVEAAPRVDALTAALEEQYDVPGWILRLPGPQALLGATAPTILRTLAHVRREHGSAEQYLVSHGLSRASLRSLRGALVG